MRPVSNFLLAFIVGFILLSCGNIFSSEEEIADRAQDLRYVAVALQGYIDFKISSATVPDEDLLREATKDNPTLLTPLSGYYLAARRVGQFSSVLMCDRERTRTWVEDAGCTAVQVDYNWEEPVSSCGFKLDLPSVCAAR